MSQITESPSTSSGCQYPNHVYYVILFLILILTLFPLLDTGFVSVDDMRNNITFLTERDSIFARTYQIAVGQGRFNFFISFITTVVPNLVDSIVFYKTITFVHVLLNLLLFAWVIQIFFRSKLFTLFSFGFFCLSLQDLWEHFLLLHDPFHGQLPLTFVFLSLIYFKKHIETNKYFHLGFAAFLFFLGSCVYEASISYLFLFFALSIFYSNNISGSRFKNLIHLFFPYLLSFIIFMVLYFAFRIIHPSKYAGTSLDLSSLPKILHVIYQFAISSFPTYIFQIKYYIFQQFSDTFAGIGTFNHYLTSIRPEWIVRAILGSFLTYALLTSRAIIFTTKTFMAALFSGSLLIISPTLPVSLVKQYQDWVAGGCIAYVVTYYSFFGWVFFLSSILFFLNQQIFSSFFSKLYIAIITFLVGGISLLTSYSNHYIAYSQTQSHQKWKIVDEFLKISKEQIPENSIIYAPSLLSHSMNIAAPERTYWTEYFSHKAGKRIQVVDEKDIMQFLVRRGQGELIKIYSLKYAQEEKDQNQFIACGPLNDFEDIRGNIQLYSNKASVYSLSKNKNFLLFFALKNDNTLKTAYVDDELVDIRNDNFFIHKILKSHDKSRLVETQITANNLNVDSILLSYYTNINESILKEFSITWSGGFFSQENDENSKWRWCSKQGDLLINNYTNKDLKIFFETLIETGFKQNSNIIISNNSYHTTLSVNNDPKLFSNTLIIPAGVTAIHFQCDAPKIDAPGDPRELIFRLRNCSIKLQVPYQFGQTIHFDDKTSIEFSNWYDPESNHRWAQGQKGFIGFPLGNLISTETEYLLVGKGFTHGRQKVEIRINNFFVATLSGDGALTWIIPVKAQILKPNVVNRIEFYTPGAKSPQNQDNRVLGFAIQELKFARKKDLF